MNTCVVYESQFGNTEQVARSLGRAFSAFGTTRVVRVDEAPSTSLEGMDLLVVGCPTQKFQQMPAMRALLESLSPAELSHLSIVCFDTRVHMPWPLNRTATQAMVKQLRGKGVEPIVPPEGFLVTGQEGPLVDGELERAAKWAVSIHQAYEATHLHIAPH